MKHWAYKRVEFAAELPSVSYLDAQGEEHWELTALVSVPPQPEAFLKVTVYVAYFKRPRK